MKEEINWISVEDELPENQDSPEWVLFVSPDFGSYTWVGIYDYRANKNGCVAWRDVDDNPVNVTHWAHLPKGPQV